MRLTLLPSDGFGVHRDCGVISAGLPTDMPAHPDAALCAALRRPL